MGLQSDNGEGSKGFGKMQKEKQKGIIITEGTTMGLQSDNGDGSKGFRKMQKEKQKGVIITEGTTVGLQSDNGDGLKGFRNMQKQKQKGIIITEGTTVGLQSDIGDGSKGFRNLQKQKQKGIIITEGTTMGLQYDNGDGWKGEETSDNGEMKGAKALAEPPSADIVFLEVKISEMAVQLNRLVILKPEALVREWFGVLEGHHSTFALMNKGGEQFNVEIQVTAHSSVLVFEENFLASNGAKVGDTLKFNLRFLPPCKVFSISFGRASSKWKKVFLSCCSGPKVFEG